MAREMNELWPTRYMLFDVLSWKFAKYVVHQDYYIEALQFFIKDSNLTNNQFWNELEDVEDKISKDHNNST